MSFTQQRRRWTSQMMQQVVWTSCCLGCFAAFPARADEVPPARPDAPSAIATGTRIPARDLSQPCYTYGNVKSSIGKEGSDSILKMEYGTGDGIYGGVWFSIPAPTLDNTQCRGIALNIRGNGNRPGRAYLFLRTAAGGAYRSKQITDSYANKQWHEIFLSAADFEPDPDSKTETQATLPKQPVWTDLRRMDFSAVNLEAEPALEIKSIAFQVGGEIPKPQPVATLKPSELPKDGRIPAFSTTQKAFTFANAKATNTTDASASVLKLEYGTGDGIFGGAWFPVSAPRVASEQCRGVGLTLRGNGNKPGNAYLFIRNKDGSYRSKDIASAFAGTQWTDLLLPSDAFIPDPSNKAAAAKMPAKVDWTTVQRIDISAVNIQSEPALEIKAVYFVVGDAALTVATPAANPAPAASTEDFPADPPAGVILQTNAGSDALTPMPKKVQFPEGTWWQRHQRFVARAKQGNVDLLWLGDSITDNWSKFKGTYRQLYPTVKAANFGIGGDGTQNLLWRLQNGELDGLSPKVAIVLIGTNNVQWHQSAQISSAIEKIVQTIRQKCPTTKVLLLGIFPRGDLAAGSAGQLRIPEVNATIAKLDDGKNVRYLDLHSKVANPDGSIIADAFADKVHLSPKGFTIWAQSMQPLLDELMR